MRFESNIPTYTLNKLHAILTTYAGEQLPEWSTFVSDIRLVSYPAGEIVYDHSARHDYVYLVEDGLLKARSSIDGRPMTMFFAEEGDILAPLSAFDTTPTLLSGGAQLHPRSESIMESRLREGAYTVSALEKSLALRANSALLMALARSHPAWATLVLRLMLMRAAVLQADAYWLRLPPAQRYAALTARNPALVARVSQSELALYLNVAPETLSRIIGRSREAPQP